MGSVSIGGCSISSSVFLAVLVNHSCRLCSIHRRLSFTRLAFLRFLAVLLNRCNRSIDSFGISRRLCFCLIVALCRRGRLSWNFGFLCLCVAPLSVIRSFNGSIDGCFGISRGSRVTGFVLRAVGAFCYWPSPICRLARYITGICCRSRSGTFVCGSVAYRGRVGVGGIISRCRRFLLLLRHSSVSRISIRRRRGRSSVNQSRVASVGRRIASVVDRCRRISLRLALRCSLAFHCCISR